MKKSNDKKIGISDNGRVISLGSKYNYSVPEESTANCGATELDMGPDCFRFKERENKAKTGRKEETNWRKKQGKRIKRRKKTWQRIKEGINK
jgi:hypothetical protein